MGLGRFEVRIFSWEKFTKFDLAPTIVIKSHLKVGYTRSMMFLRIWLKNFFFGKSRMGTPLDSKFLTLKKKSHLHLLLGQTRAQKIYRSKFDKRYVGRMCFSSLSFLTNTNNPMDLKGFFYMESLFVGKKKVASNRLRFQQKVAWVYAVIARTETVGASFISLSCGDWWNYILPRFRDGIVSPLSA